VSLLVELLDGSVIEMDVNKGDAGDHRGLVGGALPGEVGDSKTGVALGYPSSPLCLQRGSLLIPVSGRLCSGTVLQVGQRDPLLVVLIANM